ncbi:NUMOD4 domain-containing protein [Chryseobacterium sp. Y16C]|uniref:NUMOD4 domain-containing protein n=1 Tax=Chryseobacterium sp. Y16C TaxID=2920939 RepID=UPI001F0AFB3B|nr:NUMOD4 domain-containing protein [Chryseobacterium sp. Y16C]UMQ40549.1 NUMOD4 domain-containing protein [Chryseobacterium sp. Y16C]
MDIYQFFLSLYKILLVKHNVDTIALKLPAEFEHQYVKEVIYNRSLSALPGEEWKTVEDFPNYAISSFGRLKSLERWTFLPNKTKGKKEPEMIMKLVIVKQSNQYLQKNFYQFHCTLSSDGKKHRKSMARLVYYHFVEKFDYNDYNIKIAFKDGNSLHLHYTNLEKISHSESRYRTFQSNRARNRNAIYSQPVSQYDIDGNFIAAFDSMYSAEKVAGVGCESIMDAAHGVFLTAGGYRWFLSSHSITEKDFEVIPNFKGKQKIFNQTVWKNLGKPLVERKNPPACMNLSLEDLPGECWKPIPGSGNRFVISNKGRVKRLSGWITEGRKVFLREHILSQYVDFFDGKPYALRCILRHQKRNRYLSVPKALVCCFVREFDMEDKTFAVVNNNEPFWKFDLSKMYLTRGGLVITNDK